MLHIPSSDNLFLSRPPASLCNLTDSTRRLDCFLFPLFDPFNDFMLDFTHSVYRLVDFFLCDLLLLRYCLLQFVLKMSYFSRLVLSFFDCLQLQPSIVGDLVGEEGAEKAFQDGAAKGFVVCTLISRSNVVPFMSKFWTDVLPAMVLGFVRLDLATSSVIAAAEVRSRISFATLVLTSSPRALSMLLTLRF